MAITQADIDKMKAWREKQKGKVTTIKATGQVVKPPKISEPRESESSLQSRYEDLVSKRNEIKQRESEKAKIDFTPSTTVKLPVYREDGTLTDYGTSISNQLNPTNQDDAEYAKYVQNARNTGSGFASYEDFVRLKTQPKEKNNYNPNSYSNTGTYQPTGTIQQQMQSLEDAQRNRAVSALDKARIGQLSALDAQKEQVSPLAIRQRAKVGQSAQRSAKDLSTYLANRGLSSSGEVGRGTDRISAEQIAGESAITQAEQDQLNAIERARAGVETGYQSDVANVEAGLAATALQNQINASQQELQRNQQLQDLANQRAYNEQIESQERARQEQEFARQQEIANIGQYSNQEGGYQAEINRRMNNNDPSDDYLIPQLQIARNQKIAGIEQGQASAQETAYKQAFDRFNKLGYVANQQDAEILNLPVGSRTATYANQLRDDARVGVRGGGSDTPDKGETWATWENIKGNDPTQVDQFLKTNAQQIINSVGKNGYDAMVEENRSRLNAQTNANALLGGLGNLFGGN
jgi:hypothetical protein